MTSSLSDIRYMIFSGGGVNGAVSCGAWLFMERLFQVNGLILRDRLDRLAGCSVGALLAVCLTMGLGALDAMGIFYPMVVRIRTQRLSLLRALSSSGMTNLAPVRDSLSQQMILLFGSADLTLGELLQCTGKDLVIIVSEVRSGTVFHLSGRATPHAHVIDAVIASMSIPIVFEPQRIRGLHRCMYFVDGAVLINFPIHLFPPQHTLGLWLTDLPRSLCPTLEEVGRMLDQQEASEDPPSIAMLMVSVELSLCKRLSHSEQKHIFSEHAHPSCRPHIIPLFTSIPGIDLSATELRTSGDMVRRGMWLAALHYFAKPEQATCAYNVLVVLWSLYGNVCIHVLKRFLISRIANGVAGVD